MILFTKYPRYLELGVENMDLRLSNGGKLPLMRHRHHLVHVTYLAPHSTLLSVPLCVRPTLGPPAPEDICANISNCCCCSLWSGPEYGLYQECYLPLSQYWM